MDVETHAAKHEHQKCDQVYIHTPYTRAFFQTINLQSARGVKPKAERRGGTLGYCAFNETEIKQLVAISVLLAATKCTKFVFGRGSAPDPTGGDHDAPPDPLVGWRPSRSLSAPRFSRLRRSSGKASRLGRSATSFFHSLTTASSERVMATN